MKDLVDAIETRIKSPYFGYAVFAFVALNWEALFVLFLSESSPKDRIVGFNGDTDIWTLLIIPFSFGFFIAIISPWLRLMFEYISRKPFELTDSIKLEAQHKNTIKQARLEQSRAKLFAIKENELIERAKRDEEVAEISDEDAKAKLSKELDSLRYERDMLSNEITQRKSIDFSLSEAAKDLLKEAATDKTGIVMLRNTLSSRSFQAGSKTFGKEDAREFAKYESALEELMLNGYIKERGHKGEIFELTSKGWSLSEKL